MDLAVVSALVGLALVDSTSVGTLVLPALMLAHPRVRAGRVLLYLLTLSLFYLALGVALLLGADALSATWRSVADSRAVDWVQLTVGAMMLIGSFWPETPWAKRARARRVAGGGAGRVTRWVDVVAAERSRASAVVGIALLAGVIEAASMMPYLGAVALIGASGLGLAAESVVVAAYVGVMALPALTLLTVRLAAHRRLESRLERLTSRLTGRLGRTTWWVVGILGFLLLADAASRLVTD